MNSFHFSVVILAAGLSSRMGRPKQLLPYKGITLLQQAIGCASASDCSCHLVVLGANAALVSKEIDQAKTHITLNPAWEEGMASSIRNGMQNLLTLAPGTEGVVLMVCDQPYVTPSLLNSLVTTHLQTGKPVVTSGYGNVTGPPVFFHHSLFPELLRLTGDSGAKKIVQLYKKEVALVPFPEGRFDIDTEIDYQELIKGQ
jgi:molybdenum cofactor cytidylyltransferase